MFDNEVWRTKSANIKYEKDPRLKSGLAWAIFPGLNDCPSPAMGGGFLSLGGGLHFPNALF